MNTQKAIRQLEAIRVINKGKEMRLAAQWPQKYQILIATILSAVTMDEVTIVVCEKLFKKYPNFKSLGQADIEEVKQIIRPVNFHQNKAKYIIETSKILSDKPVPNSTEELIKLPGVGRKVANVYLVEAHKMDKIGVDTHVARISQKLGWSNNANPNKIEQDLEALFPKTYWNRINETLVIFGKSTGLSRRKEDEVLEEIKKLSS